SVYRPLPSTGAPAISAGNASVTACRHATRYSAGLNGADKGAHELAVDLLCHCVHVDALARQEFSCIGHAVDARRLDTGLLEASSPELGRVFILFQRAGDAADPQQHVAAQLFGHLSAGHHIGYRKSSAGLQYAKRLTDDLILVCRKIDYTI